MKYVSTRGNAPVLSFDDVLLAGLARDGGLYVPQSWPQFSASQIRAMRGLSYHEIAIEVMAPFVEGCLSRAELTELVVDTYAGFTHPAVAPLKQLGRNQWVLELFHGPTIAFKDYALQLVGRLFDHVLKKRGQHVTIVGATSGDTGSAAIEACRDRDSIDIVILHPHGRTSDVQRRQMTSVLSDNVRNLAVNGTFDDCQDMVKALFNDHGFRDTYNLSAVNSINWARVMAQIVYYFASAVALGSPDVPMTFSVPTGNFGNVFAGFCARQMGLPVEKFIVGSNSNDILTRFFETGVMNADGVVPTLSPSMDIQVSSNFERLVFHYLGNDGVAVGKLMDEFRATGRMDMPQGAYGAMRELFEGYRYNDDETLAVMKVMRAQTGEMLDPHSAIGVAAGIRGHSYKRSTLIALATAHPAKFPDAVEKATGIRPPLPDHMADLFERPERFDVIANDLAAVRDYVATFAGRVRT
ncbi:threonine synthase [Magnetospirillum gryphiswaldense MSR-1 v2]|uniref:Threonine synthase n=1 Tax=Magnetospirillum gryphiswaldense (strain DSM 6361 / JCM 21280 / NBRC 15271 / MSR-1) TaxID=431944 RepID=V6F4E2_MAGGM|nr:threonine synthase [Magnetospirillum gryphiswaldense]CDL00309.1 threonine synthase [Magnetospirillum gryphiswaldense MSR-1 v2]